MFEKGNRRLLFILGILDVSIYLLALGGITLSEGFEWGIPWGAFVGAALATIGAITFIGFYIFADDMRTAIAAAFFLFYIVLLTELLISSSFREAISESAGQAVLNTFTTMVTTVIVFYFGTTAVERATKIVQDAKTQRSEVTAQATSTGSNSAQQASAPIGTQQAPPSGSAQQTPAPIGTQEASASGSAQQAP